LAKRWPRGWHLNGVSILAWDGEAVLIFGDGVVTDVFVKSVRRVVASSARSFGGNARVGVFKGRHVGRLEGECDSIFICLSERSCELKEQEDRNPS